MKAINWLVDHWEAVLAVAWALLSFINSRTAHYDVTSGVRRVLAIALDGVSWLYSRDSATGEGRPRGLPLKIPGVQFSPSVDRIARRVAEIKGVRNGQV